MAQKKAFFAPIHSPVTGSYCIRSQFSTCKSTSLNSVSFPDVVPSLCCQADLPSSSSGGIEKAKPGGLAGWVACAPSAR